MNKLTKQAFATYGTAYGTAIVLIVVLIIIMLSMQWAWRTHEIDARQYERISDMHEYIPADAKDEWLLLVKEAFANKHVSENEYIEIREMYSNARNAQNDKEAQPYKQELIKKYTQ